MNESIKKTEQRIHFQDITDQIQYFEKDNIDWLIQEEFMGWNLWSIIKKPLFYSIKHTNYNLKSPGKIRPNKFLESTKSIGQLFKFFYYLLTIRQADIVIASDVNRIELEEGKYVDKFFGPLLKQKLIRNTIYFENHRSKDTKGISRHVNTTHFNALLGLLWRHFAKRKYFIEKANLFTTRFNNSICYDIPANGISSKTVLELITYFYAEFVLYKFFWSWLKPNRIFIVDGIPRGVVAASKIKNIPIYEFQHGFVSDKKPDYIIDRRFKMCKGKMVIPDYIMVFGQYFKDLLLKSGYWEEEDVSVIGSYSLDKVRNSTSFSMPEANENSRILWATQPTSFESAKGLLDDLMAMDLNCMCFYFKLHPLEPAHHKEWYSELCIKSPGNFKMINPQKNFFEALNGMHILISFHSTVLLEAIALGFPLEHNSLSILAQKKVMI